tara:strand:+ start:378 stop:830 length:453 start_codon:yes stop_codon:yes gene_type:complete
MQKKNLIKQKKELEQLKEWCSTIIDFLIRKNNNEQIFIQLREVVNKTFKDKNLKGLRYCKKDLNEWTKGLDINEVLELNKLLNDKFGYNLCERFNDLDKIIKRGIINNIDEYKAIINRVEEICSSDTENEKELAVLNQLLIKYEKDNPAN